MHNLNLTFFKEFLLKDLPPIKEFRIDPTDNDKVYFCHDDRITLVSLSILGFHEVVNFPCPIVGFEFLAMNNELCIATEDGAVYVHNLSTGMQEEVTYCEDGIAAMQFSHDQETFVVVTKKANVVVLNCAYDVVHETNLLDEFFGEKQFINVGWGKEETQFQGLAGKKAAATKKHDDGVAVEQDAKTSITWREDCEYFAVSFLAENRMFKVFNKEGVLQFTSEKCSGLQNSIAWRPSGNWIAIPEVYRNKYTISLFEKNGLKHREIILPFNFDEEVVVDLAWSLDSEILLIQTRRNEKDCLYLYTIGNYHWYLKQTLRFEAKIAFFEWSPRSNEKKSLYVSLENGQLLSYQWNYIVNHSRGNKSNNDEGVVAVIDGKKLLLTGFRGTVVPPPMSNIVLEHENEINFVSFIHENDQNSNQFIIVDSKNVVSKFDCRFSTGPVRVLNGFDKKGSFSFKIGEELPLKLHKWIFKNESELIFANDKLIFYGKFSENDNEIDVQTCHELKNSNLGTLVLENGKLFGHFSSGEVFTINENDENRLLKVGQFSSKVQIVGEDVIMLQPWQNLYLNDQILASNVTSFTVSDNFLMYTTLEELHFVNLASNNHRVVSERKLERGSKIILVVPGTSKTILQLPRGNLETIHPRILSLCMIRALLDEKCYKKAFEIMRKERINLNLLVDHNPNAFLEQMDAFIDDIDNIQWLNLFLTELQNVDVIGEMYSFYHLTKMEWKNFLPANKVNFVCQKMIEVLTKRDDSKFYLPLITCYVKRNEVGDALKLIWQLKLKEDAGKVTQGTTSDETFKYLLYLVNVNDLYNIALGLYDFALVLYVAKRSQKDPKEYVPFLEELDKLEENYRRYKIDCHIKRFEAALRNISQCGDEKLNEAIILIEKHELYGIALECYKPYENCYKTVCGRYGDFLRQKHKLQEASFMYERAGDFQSAISCARNALAWRRCLFLAEKRNNSTKEEVDMLVTSLIPALEGAGRHAEAGEIAKKYVGLEKSIEIYVRGKLFDDALLVCHQNELRTLIEAKIKPSVAEYVETLLLTLEEETDLFKKQKDRLLLLRHQKANPENDEAMDDDVDLYSDTSSMNSSRYTGSSMSGKSSKSSKQRRKHERKLFSLKEGSKFEDIALVDALHKIVVKIFNNEHLKHIKSVLTVATELQLDELARKLQTQYKNSMHLIKVSLNDIWIPEMIVSEEINPCAVTGTINYDQIQRNQHYSLIKPHQRYKPELADFDFELEIYK
ncbi:LOW QUALITY PROTEIN: elongator complex protein 1 [Culicoides brevitarsis]|uniref:LOW QUALITY PROTEIN: elongator complex protein 1 n=1 Tax=Culicoides brevitarsis TaxID=469753 RepID=UPI00307BA137